MNRLKCAAMMVVVVPIVYVIALYTMVKFANADYVVKWGQDAQE